MARRYSRSKMSRYRGGFLPVLYRGASTALKNPAVRDYMTGISYRAANAVSSYLPQKFNSRVKKITGRTTASWIQGLAGKFMGKSAVIIPGIGVLKNPYSKSAYQKITNKGTGITTTNYVSGTTQQIPKSVEKNAYKQQYVVSSTGENFPLSNTGAASYTTRGVAQYVHMDDADLNAFATLLPSNTDAKSDLATMYMSSCKSVISMTSSTNMNVSVRIYECVSKKDTNIATYRTPEVAWQNGIDQTVGTSDTNSYKNIGVYPSMSPFFRDYWHVDGYYDVELAAGASHIHKSTYNINSYVPFSWFRNHGGSAATSGLTRAYLFVLSTTPIHDASNEDAIALGKGKVDINIVNTYEFYGIPFTDEGLSYDLGSDSIATTQELVTDSDFIETGVVN